MSDLSKLKYICETLINRNGQIDISVWHLWSECVACDSFIVWYIHVNASTVGTVYEQEILKHVADIHR